MNPLHYVQTELYIIFSMESLQEIAKCIDSTKQELHNLLDKFTLELYEKTNECLEDDNIDPHPNVTSDDIIHLKSTSALAADHRQHYVVGRRCDRTSNIDLNVIVHVPHDFPIYIKLQKGEYVVYYVIVSFHYDHTGYGSFNTFGSTKCIYLTNYGRFIKNVYGHSTQQCPNGTIMTCTRLNLSNNNLHITNSPSYNGSGCAPPITMQTINISDIPKEPKLTYKIPMLFLKVNYAFNKMDTDKLQECAKEYHDLKHKIISQKDTIEQLTKKNMSLQTENDILRKQIQMMYRS